LWKDLKWKKIEYCISQFGLDLNQFSRPFSLPTSYWELVFATFSVMALFCFILATVPIFQHIDNIIRNISSNPDYWSTYVNNINNIHNNNIVNIISTMIIILLFLIILIASFFVFNSNLKRLFELEKGIHSYKANRALWESILIDKIPKKDLGS
jgi:hypothetical protein